MKWRMQIAIIFLSIILYVFAFSPTTKAHESRPIYIELTENDQFTSIFWSTPSSLETRLHPIITLSGCKVYVSQNQKNFSGANVKSYICPSAPTEQILKIDFPSYNPSLSAVVKYRKNAKIIYAILAPGTTQWHIPQSTVSKHILRNYFLIGMRHILSGIDHLLFLAALVFITRTPMRTLKAVTGFTLAHSLTIALLALKIISVPSAVVEVLIALSIVFLASEAARNNKNSLTWRRPVFAASIFGLFHGMGFASLLSEIGLPDDARIPALAFFNLGVEVGQIFFITITALVFILARKAIDHINWPASYYLPNKGTLYGLGILASFWFFERIFIIL